MSEVNLVLTEEEAGILVEMASQAHMNPTGSRRRAVLEKIKQQLEQQAS